MTAGLANLGAPWRPPPQGQWTYADYLHLPDNGFRYEVLDGDLHMSATPPPRHQGAVNVLAVSLSEFLKPRDLGTVILGPVDVLLNQKTVAVPDLVVVLNSRKHILTERAIEGTPDLLVEVLAPETQFLDRRCKFALYARRGVREYWIADLEERAVEVYVLRGQAYALLGKFALGQRMQSEVLSGFSLDVAEVFAF